MNRLKMGTLTKVIEGKDAFDKQLTHGVLLFLMHNNVKVILDCWANRQKLKKGDVSARYGGIIFESVQCLVKANAHRRKYKVLEKKAIKELKEDAKKNPGVNTANERLDLTSEIDAFLSQLKASLDILVESLNVLFDLKLHGWHKVKGESGKNVLNALNGSLSKDTKEKTKKLSAFIEESIQYITYIVELRDQPTHHGRIKYLKPLTYDTRAKKVLCQYISHDGKSYIPVNLFLDKTIENFVNILKAIVIYSLSNLVNGLTIATDPKGDLVWVLSLKKKPTQE